MSYYPPYKSSSNNVKVELDLKFFLTAQNLKLLEKKIATFFKRRVSITL